MTAGLKGSGAAHDQWLIETPAQLLAVLTDGNHTGYYRVEVDLRAQAQSIILPIVAFDVANSMLNFPKVIDCNGFHLPTFVCTRSAPSTGAVVIGIHFLNGLIPFYLNNSTSTSLLYIFYQCFFTDFYVSLGQTNATSNTNAMGVWDGYPSLISREFVRLVVGAYNNPGAPLSGFTSFNLASAPYLNISDFYIYTNATISDSRIIKRTSRITLESLPGSFRDAGWWEYSGTLLPYQTTLVNLDVVSRVSSVNVSRMLWVENLARWMFLGETDEQGGGQYSLRLRVHSTFTIVASEDVLTDELRDGMEVFSGRLYLPPSGSMYVFRAEASGVITGVAGVSFGSVPVSVSGITFTPRPRFQGVVSDRRSVSRDGISQAFTLDTGGDGGGPVIVGDPAYLEGTVEDIHPMTGFRRALSNCEVVAFERRGSDYVVMGSAYSNGVGGFRLETEVYGGGDVFAFAADFPGVIFQPGATLNAGDRIRPALANGYVYEIVQPGTAGGAEPVWWPDAGGGTEGNIGTAVAKARPYYQPIGHGPLKMTLIE